jgi:hypothetical protein
MLRVHEMTQLLGIDACIVVVYVVDLTCSLVGLPLRDTHDFLLLSFSQCPIFRYPCTGDVL